MAERWATFDCYGTLIDWNGGIGGVLSGLFPTADGAELLAHYHRIEPEVQAGRAIAYREVLTETLARLAAERGLPLTGEERSALADSLPSWPPFEEVPEALAEIRERGWKIGILSNTDPEYLDASLRLIGVAVDLRITAAEAGAYKPDHRHWERFRAETGASVHGHVHVGASLFHDAAPAAELGIPFVWINRLGEESDLPRVAELPDLSGLPDALEGAVPAG
jgi:2-haloacid dehalogenase